MLTNPWYNPQSTVAPGMTLYDLLDCGYDLGMQDYPIWDESKREWLNEQIVDRFLFREICAETPQAFIRWFNRRLRQSMTQLNVIFESNSTLKTHADLLNNMEINESHTTETTSEGNAETSGNVTTNGTAQTNSKNTVTSNASGQNYVSTDPAISMVGVDTVEYYDSGTRTEQSGKDVTDSSVSSTSNESSSNAGSSSNQAHALESYSMNHKGHYGRTLTGAIREYFESYSDTLELLFDDLEVCFIQIWRP